MITYEVNIVCDTKNCNGACVVSEPHADVTMALCSASEKAVRQGWETCGDSWFCPDCCAAREVTE